MRIAAMRAKSGTDRPSFQAAGSKQQSGHLMTPALMIDDVAGAEFREAEEPRAIDSLGLVADLQERSHRQAREVVTRRESRAAEISIWIEVGLLAPVADV